MTVPPQLPDRDDRDDGDPGRRPGFFDPERYAWPPDPAAVQVFVLAVFVTGGPLTWWAVTR